MISAACSELGERALIGAAGSDFSSVPHLDHVKVVGAVNYATVFPACRALVHHGGSSTTPIAMRAGVPQLILFWDLVHAVYGASVKRLRVGAARRFSTATRENPGRGFAHHSRPGVRRPRPRAGHQNDRTRQKRRGGRRPLGKFRPHQVLPTGLSANQPLLMQSPVKANPLLIIAVHPVVDISSNLCPDHGTQRQPRSFGEQTRWCPPPVRPRRVEEGPSPHTRAPATDNDGKTDSTTAARNVRSARPSSSRA